MDQHDLMKKAAQAIRQLEKEKQGLLEKLEDLEKTASHSEELAKQAEAAQIVLRLVADGEADPEDALDKFAEVSTLDKSNIELLLRKCETEKLGQVKVDSVSADVDPLTSYLLGT
jgi:hypothetical protein